MTRDTTNHPAIDPGTTFDGFYNASQPQKRKGRAWTFEYFREACDTPGAGRVHAILTADAIMGFALYARQSGCLHLIVHNGRPVRFRTIEQALDALSDVPYLAPEIAIDTASW